MPVGGGNLQLNVWAENDEILFYIGSTDSYLEKGSDLAKLGRMRLNFSPSPFTTEFHQELDLCRSEMVFTNNDGFKLIIWVDVFQPVVHLEMTSETKVEVKATYETWKLDARFNNNEVLFHHRNPEKNMELTNSIALQRAAAFQDKINDPLKNLTIGGILYAENLVKAGEGEGTYLGTKYKSYSLKSSKYIKTMDLRMVFRMEQDSSKEEWVEGLDVLKSSVQSTRDKDRKKSIYWWNSFWNRSYIHINPTLDANTALEANIETDTTSAAWHVGRNYQLSRYMLGCSKGAKFAVLFNGGIFNVDSHLGIPENRNWQDCQFMAQNQRLVYWPLLKTGDFDLMEPVINMYRDFLPLQRARAKHFWGIEGAAYPEALSIYGLHSVMGTNDPDLMHDAFGRIKDYTRTEWGHNGFVHLEHHYTTSLEFAYMLLEYARFGACKLSDNLPVIESAVKYYDNYYQKKSKSLTGNSLDSLGKLIIYPSSSLELYGDAKNPTDVLSGMRAIVEGVLSIPEESISAEKYNYFNSLLERIPEIKTFIINDREVLQPAETWALEGNQLNMEFPQLYALFPFKSYFIGEKNLEVPKNTWLYNSKASAQKNYICWFQGGIFSAHLGLINEAKKFQMKKFLHQIYNRNKNGIHPRFPTFWENNHFCHTPDMDQVGSAMVGLQDMIIQTKGKKILLFPAWPKDWNANFKLHAPYDTTIEGQIFNGVLVSLAVNPTERKDDVIVMVKSK